MTVPVPAGPAAEQRASFRLQHLVPLTTLTGLGYLACRVAREQQQGAKVKLLLQPYREVNAMLLLVGVWFLGMRGCWSRHTRYSHRDMSSRLLPHGGCTQLLACARVLVSLLGCCTTRN